MISNNNPTKLLLISLIIVWLPIGGFTQERRGQWPCGKHPKLLRDKSGVPVWLKSEQLKTRSINQVAPKLPSSVRVEGTIFIDVLVNTEGQVKCVRTKKGHPILRRAAEDAVVQWTFKPLLVNDEPVAVFGSLSFHFSN